DDIAPATRRRGHACRQLPISVPDVAVAGPRRRASALWAGKRRACADVGLRAEPAAAAVVASGALRRRGADRRCRGRRAHTLPAGVLIHCHQGRRRSILLAYAVLRLRGRGPEEALADITTHRLEARPVDAYVASVERWLACGAPLT